MPPVRAAVPIRRDRPSLSPTQPRCRGHVDRHFEIDPVILALELALHRAAVLRHLVFNRCARWPRFTGVRPRAACLRPPPSSFAPSLSQRCVRMTLAWLLLDAYAAWYARSLIGGARRSELWTPASTAHPAPWPVAESAAAAAIHDNGGSAQLALVGRSLSASDASFAAVALLTAAAASSACFAACWAWHRKDLRRSPLSVARALAVGGAPRLLFLALPVWRYPVALVLAVFAAAASLTGEAAAQLVEPRRALSVRVVALACALAPLARIALA